MAQVFWVCDVHAEFICIGMQRRHNMRLLEGDAADHILQLASQVQQGQIAPLDIAFVDAFDGNDDVPSVFCSPGSFTLWLTAVPGCCMTTSCTICHCMINMADA